MANREEITGAKIVQHRTLAWAETDAAGHNHFSAALRWLEEAEHLLWACLGLADVTPATPRVHVDLDFRGRIYFGDPFIVTLGVARVGRTSATFAWSATGPDDALLVEGHHVVAHAPLGGRATPWSEHERLTLLSEVEFVAGA